MLHFVVGQSMCIMIAGLHPALPFGPGSILQLFYGLPSDLNAYHKRPGAHCTAYYDVLKQRIASSSMFAGGIAVRGPLAALDSLGTPKLPSHSEVVHTCLWMRLMSGISISVMSV